MISLSNALKERINAARNGFIEKQIEKDGKEYNKKYNEAVQCFQKRINSDRRREYMLEVSFIIIRQKLLGVREIDDLKWFYGVCEKYSRTKDKETGIQNTFSRGFFGALK